MRRAVLRLVAVPAVGALTVACGGSVSVVPPGESDSGSPISRLDAAPPETDASIAYDSTGYADAIVPPDAPDDIAPNPPEAGPPACSMQLDPTFGVGGIATFVNPAYSRPSAIAFEPGGKMVVSMWDATETRDHQVAIARFDSAGAIDPTYGDGGFATLAPSAGQDDNVPGQVLVQPDGKSLVVAWNENTPALGRFGLDGTIDATFGSNAYGPGGGYAEPTTPWPNWWRALALFDDGSIVVGGQADFNTAGGWTLFLAKYDHTGLVDTSFGAGGSVSALGMGPCSRLLAQPDGSLLVGGGAAPSYSSIPPALTRYTASGALDVGFGSGGTATAPANSGGIIGMATQSTGAIVVAAARAVLRYTPGGQLDPTFGNAGIAPTDLFGEPDYAIGLSVLPDDSLLVAGSVSEPTDAGHLVDFAVARYNADGQPDTSFAPGGKLVTRFPQGGVDDVYTQGLQADGKLVVAGYGVLGTDAGEEHVLTLARYTCR